MNYAPAFPARPEVLRRLTLVAATIALIGTATFAASDALADDGYLGVRVQTVDEALAAALDLDEADGVLVSDVIEDSPAEAAGLQQGDLILSVDGRDASDPDRFTRRVRRVDPGETVALEIVRKGKPMTLDVTMGEAENVEFLVQSRGHYPGRSHDIRFYSDEDAPFDSDNGFTVDIQRGLHTISSGNMAFGGAQLGVSVHGLDENLGRYFGAEEGVLVLGVMEDTAAEEAGLQEGDVILSVDGDKVGTTMDLHEVIGEFEPGDTVAVSYMRDKQEKSVDVELGESEGLRLVRELKGSGNHGNYGQHGRSVWFDRAPRAPHAPRAIRVDIAEPREIHEELMELRERLEQIEEELEKAEGN